MGPGGGSSCGRCPSVPRMNLTETAHHRRLPVQTRQCVTGVKLASRRAGVLAYFDKRRALVHQGCLRSNLSCYSVRCSGSAQSAAATHTATHDGDASAYVKAELFSRSRRNLETGSVVARACSRLLLCIAGVGLWSIVAGFTSGTGAGLLGSLTLAVRDTSSKGILVAQSAWTGLAAGILHTLCGPDHLAALTPLTIGRGRGQATALGALWGFGHSTGQLILGLLFVCLKERFSSFAPALSKWASTVIALTLIAIGLFGLYEIYGEEHAKPEYQPGYQLEVAGPAKAITSQPSPTSKGLTTYCTGIIYGLQPDALFVVIPALALPTKLAAIAYCTMFVTGTVTAMGGYTAVIGTTSAALSKDRPWLQSRLSTVASAVAILVGLGMLLASIAGV